MPRPASVPKLTLYKASGKAVVRLSGIDVYCGVRGTPEAKAKYDREVAEYRKAGIGMMFPSLRGGNDNPGEKEGVSGRGGRRAGGGRVPAQATARSAARRS
jgi:hypothetical protein